MNGKGSSAPSILLFAYCCISLQPPLPYANQPKTLVIPDSHHMVITLHVKSMATRRIQDGMLEEEATIGGICRGHQSPECFPQLV